MTEKLDPRVFEIADCWLQATGYQPAFDAYNQRLQQIFNGKWPVCYPPPVFKAGYVAQIGDIARQLLELVFQIPERIFAGDLQKMLQAQGLPQSRVEYFLQAASPRQLGRARLLARPDAILTERGFQFVEMNVTPSLGGLGSTNRCARSFESDALYHAIAQSGVALSKPDINQHWGAMMRAQCQTWSPQRATVLLELLDNPAEQPELNFAWPDFINMVKESGFEVITGNTGELTIDASGVYCRGKKVDVVYTDFVYAEQMQYQVDAQIIADLATAEANGLIDFIGSPAACAIYDNKINLAFLSSPQYRHYFTAQEAALIDQYIPPSFILNKETLPLALAQRQRFVVKPGLGLCGFGVEFGKNHDDASWQRLLEQLVAAEEPYLLQQLIEDIWTYTLAAWQGANRMICMGSIVLDGQYSGTFVREDWYDGVPIAVNLAQGSSFTVGFEAA